jgi:crotonobetainyl-CoA:carnitine CoA-transferase CaiB-like acyl-CoA transferase
MGSVAMAAVVPRLSATPGAVRHAGRDVGFDSRRVLREVLGLGDAEIDALVRSGVVVERASTRRSVELAS